jgi:uncharacterized protein (TIGR02391 family)
MFVDWPGHQNLEPGYLINVVRQGYGNKRIAPLEAAIYEAWAWLEGQALLIPDRRFSGSHEMRVLSRRAIQLAKTDNPARAFRARQMPKETLHERIREDVWGLYHRAKYDTAVFEAMKAVEVSVREAAGLPANVVGTALMRVAFDAATGVLADQQAEKSEREARAHLFAGAIGSFKNPQSHRAVDLDDPDEAAEIIMLANHLLRIVDSRTRKKTPT